LLYIIFHKELRVYLIGASKAGRHFFSEILRIGLPIAGMFCIEVGFFTVMALIMGRLGSKELAANQIVQQFIGFFTVIISFTYAQAVSIRVANAFGRRDLSSTNNSTYAGLVIACSLMLIVACCYWFIPHLLISIDLNPYSKANFSITQLAAEFMVVAGFVQIFESARIVLFGSLRGLGETRFSLLTSLIIFWLIAFPIGLLLTFVLHFDGIGMWIGMAVGTLVGAVLLFWWLQKSVESHSKRLLALEKSSNIT
jgi:MATE family multidrug resistance protein